MKRRKGKLFLVTQKSKQINEAEWLSWGKGQEFWEGKMQYLIEGQ